MGILRWTPLLLASVSLAGAPLRAQPTPQRLAVYPDAGPVRDAAYNGSDLVVLTGEWPAVRLYSNGGQRAWGARGRGPGQLSAPRNVAWVGDRILVRDSDLGKILSYDRTGSVAATRTLSGGMPAGLHAAGGDTLLSIMPPQGHLVVRLRGTHQDTVLRYAVPGETIRLSAPGAPSLSLPPPYAPRPTWTPLAGGRIAFWDGHENAVRLLDMGGRIVGRLALPATRYPVTPGDREAWIASGIPPEIQGQDVFAPLRQQARSTVPFPAHFPAVLALMDDPEGGVWVRQSGSGGGERWVRLAQGQAPVRVQLPAGQRLLAIGRREMAALAPGAQGAHSIIVYAKPSPGGGAARRITARGP